MLEASMLVIGDEILGGYVTDTNSPWLAQRLRAHGIPLTRVHVVPDEPAAIDEALDAERARARPRVVLTSGGIGSTPDDLTYEAVAASLGLQLVEDPTMAGRVDQALAWSRQQGLEAGSDHRRHLARMARVPAGSRLLWREDGWSPAVTVDVDGGSDGGGVTVVVLPGVPAEFRALVTEVVEPALFAGRNEVPHVVQIEHAYPESVLNLTFADLQRRHPQVKLGSYPGVPMLVRLSGPPEPVEAAAALVRRFLDDLDASDTGRRLAASWNRRRAPASREEDR